MKQRAFLAAALITSGALIGFVEDATHESFAAHMVQHLGFVFVVAPLLALATSDAFRPRGLWATSVVSVVLLHAVALWAWHLPALYDAALDNALLHSLEHLSFIGTAWLFWLLVLHPGDELRRSVAVFATGLQSAALGALLTFASEPLYGHTGVARWDLTALEDQQLAGGIMWVPPGVVYLAVTLILVGLGLRRSDRPVVET